MAQLSDILRQNQKNGLNEFLFGPSNLFIENQIKHSSFLKRFQRLESEITLIKDKLETLQNHPPNVSGFAPKQPVNEDLDTSDDLSTTYFFTKG